MEDLPHEMLNEILLLLDKPSLFQASNTCKLWRRLALTHVETINTKEQLQTAAENGDRLSIIKSACDNIDWDNYEDIVNGFSLSVMKSMMEAVSKLNFLKPDHQTHEKDSAKSLMIGGYLSRGLIGACLGGHKDLAELMITKGAKNLDNGLRYACERGHEDLAELMIAKGADKFDWGLEGACEGGHKDLAELMIIKGARDYNLGLHGACSRGQKVLVKLMIDKGANKCPCGKSMWDHYYDPIAYNNY
jgi:hypothetical protein